MALSASLSWLLVLILAGPWIGAGEHFEDAGLRWAYGQPIIMLLSAASMGLFKYYRATESWASGSTFFVSNTVAVAVASFLLADVVPSGIILW